MVWLQEENYESGRPLHWPLDTNPASAAAFAATVAPAYYVGGSGLAPHRIGRNKTPHRDKRDASPRTPRTPRRIHGTAAGLSTALRFSRQYSGCVKFPNLAR